MSLYISMTRPGQELSDSPIDKAITFLATHIAIEKRQGRLPDGPILDVTFMLPYQDDKPDFQGMRMGGYNNENKTLFFETAIPEAITHSEKASFYLAMVLEDVIDNADEYFAGSEVEFNAEHWRSALGILISPEKSNIQH